MTPTLMPAAQLEHHHKMVVASAALASAAALVQLHICGHGNRGWCPWCAVLIRDGATPQ